MYRLVAESFAGREFRAVFCPLSTGRRSHRETNNPSPETQGGDFVCAADAFAPPAEAGGGGGSDSGSSAPLVKALESVKRSDFDLAERVFSRKAAERLRRIGVAAETMEPNRRGWVFCTMTWPTGTAEGMAAIARDSGWVVQQIKNFWRSKGYARSDYFYVWERQKRGTLHLHWVQRIHAGTGESNVNRDFRSATYGILRRHSRRCGHNLLRGTGGDWSEKPEALRNEAQVVRKSVARYLAKYVSKGSTIQSKHWASLGSPSPRRWWGASKSLKDTVDALTVTNRIDYTGYRAASNAFAELIDISMLRLLPNQCLRRYLNSCSGEVFTAFSGVKLCSLEHSWKTFGRCCEWSAKMQSMTPTMTLLSAQSLSLLRLLDRLTRIRDRRNYPRGVTLWASEMHNDLAVSMYRESNSGCAMAAIRRIIQTATVLLFSKSRCSSNIRIRLEIETELHEILEMSWPLSKMPIQMIGQLIGMLVKSREKPTPIPQQMTLFG